MTRFNDETELGRLSFANTNETAHVAGDWVLSAGFGASATIAITDAKSNDNRGRVTITAAGAGVAANPTATLTFKRPWAAAPVAVVSRAGGSQRTVPMEVTTLSTTQMVVSLLGTPVAAETFAFTYQVVG